MYYTNLLILLAFLLGGCAAGSITGQGADAVTTATTPSSSDEEVALYRQAITALYNSEFAQAELLFLKVIKLQPDLAGPWANLGLVYMKQGHIKKATKNAQIALKKNPRMAQAFNLLGYIETKKGNIIQAKEYYTKAIKYKQDYALAHYNLALLYDIYLQNIPYAVKHYESYLRIIEHKDKQTAEWVQELKNTLKRRQS